MRLRLVTLLSMAIILTLSLLFLYFASAAIMMRGFTRIEARDSRQKMKTLLLAMDMIQADLKPLVVDWSVWDDAYNYIETSDERFTKSNLNTASFEDLHLDLMLFLRPSGEIMFGTGFDMRQK